MPQGKTFARQEVVIGAPAPQSLAKEQKLGLDLRVRAPRYVEGLEYLELGVLRLSRGNRIEVWGVIFLSQCTRMRLRSSSIALISFRTCAGFRGHLILSLL